MIYVAISNIYWGWGFQGVAYGVSMMVDKKGIIALGKLAKVVLYFEGIYLLKEKGIIDRQAKNHAFFIAYVAAIVTGAISYYVAQYIVGVFFPPH